MIQHHPTRIMAMSPWSLFPVIQALSTSTDDGVPPTQNQQQQQQMVVVEEEAAAVQA